MTLVRLDRHGSRAQARIWGKLDARGDSGDGLYEDRHRYTPSNTTTTTIEQPESRYLHALPLSAINLPRSIYLCPCQDGRGPLLSER